MTVSGPSTIFGAPERADAGEAAGANAAAAHALDRDDLHSRSLTHPGSIIWAVVLAVGEEVDATGETALKAAAAGYEATTRIAQALGPEYRRYSHSTATAGTVGGAVAGALTMDLGRQGASTAAGHAISVAGGSMQALVERSGTRIFHRSHAARTAIASARAAAGGLDATRLGLEGERGLFAAAGSTADPSVVLLHRDRLAIEEITLRLIPSNGFSHTAIEAALELAPIEPASVASIEIIAPAVAIDSARITHPKTQEEAWWSLPYAVAVSLLEADAGRLQDPRFLRDARVDQLFDVTDVRPSRTSPGDFAATVKLHLKDGGLCAASCSKPLGNPDRPASGDDLVRKWQSMNASAHPSRARDLLKISTRIGQGRMRSFVRELADLARGPRQAAQ